MNINKYSFFEYLKKKQKDYYINIICLILLN
jgi:hypothetical protein